MNTKLAITLLTILSTTVATNAFGQVDSKVYSKEITTIKKLESSKDYKRAAIVSAQMARTIADKIEMDSVVADINNKFETHQSEKITKEVNFQGKFSALFGLISGAAKTGYDVSTILVTNPEEVATFSSREKKDFKALQKTLKNYVVKNENDIFHAKIFAAKALQMTSKLDLEDMNEVYSTVTRAAQKVSNISFLGVQNILSCTTTFYPEKRKNSSAKLGGFLLSFKVGEEVVEHAHTESLCDSRSNYFEVREDNIHSVELLIADENLEAQAQNLSLKMVEKEADIYPTWGW